MTGALVLAASGGRGVGLGHVMRCVALAEAAAARGLAPRFALDGDAAARATLRAELPDAAVEPWRDATPPARGAACVVFDTRREIGPALAALRAAGVRSVVLDRLDALDGADLTVLPVLHADAPEHPRLRAGAEWCILRPGLRALAAASGGPGRERSRSPARVFVSLGGADPARLTERLAPVLDAALARWPAGTPAPRVHCALGPAFEGAAALARRLRARGWCVHEAPGQRRWAELARGSLLAVTGFGTSVYELALLGVPCVHLAHRGADLADAERLEARGLGACGGAGPELDPGHLAATLERTLLAPDWRERGARRGRALLGDGCGAERVLAAALGEQRLCGRSSPAPRRRSGGSRGCL